MDKLIEYITSKNKMEIVVLTALFVVLPSYLVMFLYYKELFYSLDIIKMTVLIGGVLSFLYGIQIIVFAITHMIFTKVGRKTNEIITFSLATLGTTIFSTIIARVFIDDFILVYLVMIGFSVILEIIMSINFEWYERSSKDKK